MPWFEVSSDTNGYHWQLWGANGSPIARNAVAYQDEKSCLQAVRIVLKQMKRAKLVMKSSVDD